MLRDSNPDMRETSTGMLCPVCGHNKIWHYGEGGKCEAKLIPDDASVYDYGTLEKCDCPGVPVHQAGAAAGGPIETDSD